MPTNEIPDGDYILKDGCAWFTVKGFSIRVAATDEGVACDIYPLGKEGDDALAACYAFNNELEVDGQ